MQLSDRNLSNKNDDDESDSESDDKEKEETRNRSKSEKEKDKNAKRLQKFEKKQLNKIKKMERKHWLQVFYESLSDLFRNTIGYFEIELVHFDRFPRDDIREFKQNFRGLFYGALLSYLLFFLLVFTFRRDPNIALFFCMIILILSVFGMSFSKDMRCIFSLVGPFLASSRLRWVLLMYASVLTGLGPALNMMRNAGNFRSAIICVYDQIRLNFQILKIIALSPIQMVKYNIDKWRNAVKDTWQKIKNAITIIKMGLFNSGSSVNNQINYFQVLLNLCNDKLALYNQCIIFFNNVYHNCQHKLTHFKNICYMVRYIAKEACRVTDQLGEMCDNAKMQLNSLNSTESKKVMQKVDKAFETLLRHIGQKETRLYTSEKLTKDMKLEGIEVTNISENLRKKAEKFSHIVSKVKSFFEVLVIVWTIFAITFVFMQSAFFRSAWLKKDSFDNYYITMPFLLLERNAFIKKQAMVLPLVGPEKIKYVTLDSRRWTKSEKVNASRGAAFILISSISLISTLILDYLVYAFVLVIVPTFEKSYNGDKSVILDINVQGQSTLGSLIRSMLSILGPLKYIVTDVDLPICKPIPNRPNFFIYTVVLIIVFITLITLAFEVRILRARHKIMIAFYPERAIQRAIWLRTYIRNTRGSTKKFILVNISNKLRKKKTKDPNAVKLSIIGQMITQSKFWAKCLEKLGQRRVFCLSCGAEGNPKNKEALSRKFTQCFQCHSMFCKHCYSYFKNICIICNIPLDTEDVEIDLQKLSSDEDYDDFKARYMTVTERNIEKTDIPGQVN